jgi:hypothetical protein
MKLRSKDIEGSDKGNVGSWGDWPKADSAADHRLISNPLTFN